MIMMRKFASFRIQKASSSLYLDISCLDRKHSSCNFLKPASRARDAPVARPCPCQSGFIRFSQKEGNTTTKSASSLRARVSRLSLSYQWIFFTLCDATETITAYPILKASLFFI